MAYIYVLKNKINKKCYVGQTRRKLKYRIEHHISASKQNSSQLIHKAIRKYGFEEFELIAIECLVDDLNNLEDKYIEEYDSMVPNGYNLRTGGYQYTYSLESRKKMSDSHKGKTLSEEQKRKIGLKSKGNKYALGRKQTQEQIDARTLKNTGSKRSDETKKVLSDGKLGNKNPMFGKRSPRAKRTVLIHSDGKEEIFESLSDACKQYNLDVRCASKVSNTNYKYKNFMFKYLELADKLQDKSF